MNSEFSVRLATVEDANTVLSFIQKIAEYEKMTDEVVNSEDLIREVVFGDNAAKVFLGEENGKAVGFALFFETYSTFVGRKGIHLEDLFVDPDCRGKGYGKALFDAVAKYAADGNYGRLEWVCLDWNTPSQDFYFRLGAKHIDEWWIFRLDGEKLEKYKTEA